MAKAVTSGETIGRGISVAHREKWSLISDGEPELDIGVGKKKQ